MKWLGGICFLLFACAQPASHPSDNELRDRFIRNRRDFIALAQIFSANPKLGLLDERGFSIDHAARVEPPSLVADEPYRSRYRGILHKLGLKSIVRRYDGSIAFIVSESGTWEYQSGKGFELSETSLTPTVPSLDSVKLDCEQSYYAVVEPHWYLYLQSYCS